ncbi:phage tail length tape measure family protein [Escherichia coli]
MEVDKVAEAFGKLTTDPTSGLTAMARQFHNVTAEQIAYVAQRCSVLGRWGRGIAGGERGRDERV